MKDTSEDDIANFLNDSPEHKEAVGEETKNNTKNKISVISIPLSEVRLGYLEHLLDDIYCFLDYESYEFLC